MSAPAFADTLSLEDLKYVANDYGVLIEENAELLHFKEVAMKYLTKEQVERIEEEMENPPETGY